MIYEFRSYEAVPGKLPALVARFADVTHSLFLDHGMRPLGYWTEEIGDSNKLHYILAWENLEERSVKRMMAHQDPRRGVAFIESEKDGPLVARIVSSIWRPTSFSPLS